MRSRYTKVGTFLCVLIFIFPILPAVGSAILLSSSVPPAEVDAYADGWQPPDWMNSFWRQLGYLGVFLVSFIATASIIIPIPYTLLIFWLGGQGYDALLLAIAAGAGSAIGEFSGYILGYYGRRLLSLERQRKMSYLLKLFGRYGPVIIFLFALTPLPDDLLFIPLGMLRYSYVKAFIPAVLGKLLMSYVVAGLGKTAGELILVLFGQEGSVIGMIITTVLLIIFVVALYRIDWEEVFEKYMSNKEPHTRAPGAPQNQE